MKAQKTFRRKELAATISFLLAAYAGSVQAQDQDAQAADAADAADNLPGILEEVIVTASISTSIMSSIETKRRSDTIVDVVDAGGLGVLPDQSIADALGRIPGVTTVRGAGQSSQLNIRGMNGDFIQTTMNGREQASTSAYTESTRWMSFDQYPAEMISQAAVYKTPKASIIEGGVAGTVDLRTVNPLRAPNTHNVTATALYSRNDAAKDIGADESGYRYSFTYQGKFLDETLGLAIGYSSLKQPNAFVGSRSGADGQIGYDQSGDWNGDGNNDARARAFQWQAGTGEDKRDGFIATLVWQATDSLTLAVDYFDSSFKRTDTIHGITVGGLQNAATFDLSNTTVIDGVVTGATVGITNPATPWDSSPWFETRTEDQSTSADSESIGFNLAWYPTENSTLLIDIATSEATKTRKDRIASMHAYDLTYDSSGNLTDWVEAAGQSLTYTYSGSDIPDASFSGVDFTNPANIRLSRYEEYPHLYTDEIDSYQVDYKLDVDWGAIPSIEMGYRYSDRLFTSERGTFLYGSRDGQYNGYCADNLTQGDNAIACMPQSVDGFVSAQSGSGIPDHFVIDDLEGLATSIFGAGNFEGLKVFSRDWTFVESGDLQEKVDAAYLMANLDFMWGDTPVSGNFGVRYVKTDVKSIGVQNVGTGNGVPITDGVGETRTNYDYVNYGPDYSDTLPSLNLNFELTENDYLRFAASKVMGRPPAGQLKGGAGSWNSVNSDGEVEYNVWTKGSPYLDPFRANQFDLSYEHYFEDGGAVTAAIFWKDIESLVEKVFNPAGTIDFDELGIELPPGTVEGAFETFVNNDNGGYIRGLELAVTKTFTSLPGAWAGFGLTASYSYTQSETEVSGGNLYGENLPLPGLSENVWSATAFYDYKMFAAHVNVRYRDEYILNMPIPGSSTPVFAQPYTTADAQIAYQFQNGIGLIASVNNFTDEANVIEYGVDDTFGEFRQFGRQYYIGINFRY